MSLETITSKKGHHRSEAARKRLRRRYAKEKRFQAYGIAAIGVAMAALVWLLGSIVGSGLSAFHQHFVSLTVELDAAELDPQGTNDPEVLRRANYRALVLDYVRERFPEAQSRAELRDALNIFSVSGATDAIRQRVVGDPGLVGQSLTIWVPTSDDVDQLLKGSIDPDVPEDLRRVSNRQVAWVEELRESGEIEARFNTILFTNTDSRDPELAGIASALMGSILTLIVTFVLSFPIGIATAIYLEEFAPKNRFTDFIEVNINNLAAVPSIIFGLLGLAVFLNFFGMPRSAPLVGGMVLALMTLPTIIIATRAALKAVPPSIREGALGIGASPLQAVFHHVLPLAMPGILTGSIIGMAQALGETAPLLMIGMVAFVTEVPTSFTEPAAALPVQIFLWSDSAERAYVERTSAAIMVLLSVLIAMNALAVYLRRRFERRW